MPFDTFIAAIEKNDIEAVKALLSNKTPGQEIDPSANYNQAIRDASRYGNLELVKLLLQDPRVDPSTLYNESLRLASSNGHVGVVELLLKDPRVNPSAWCNESLLLASSNGHVGVVELLLKDPRVDPYVYNNNPIRVASNKGHTAIVELLRGNDRVNFLWAAEIGDKETVATLLMKGTVDPSEQDNQAIRLASEKGHTEVVHLLMQAPRVDPHLAFNVVSRNENVDIAKLLLQDPRVDPSANNNQAIRDASRYGNLELVKLLLQDPRVDPSANNNEAILLASENGHREVVYLLMQDPRVDPYAYNNNPIRVASGNRHTAVVELLRDNDMVNSMWVIEIGDTETAASISTASLVQSYQQLQSYQQPDNSDLLLQHLQQRFPIITPDLIDQLAQIYGYIDSPATRNALTENTLRKISSATPELAKQITDKLKNVSRAHDMLEDYQRTLLEASFYYAVMRSDRSEALKPIRQSLSKEPEIFFDKYPLSLGETFFKDLDLMQLVELSDHWHAPLQQTSFLKQKDFGGITWTSLFDTPNVTQNRLAIPEEIAKEEGWSIAVLTTPRELKQEGSDLKHCVGGYSEKCIRNEAHILSIRNPAGQSLSTIELITDYEKKTYTIVQHFGQENGTPCQQSKAVEQWLRESLDQKHIAIDYNYLKTSRDQRITRSDSPKMKLSIYFGFNPLDHKKLKAVRNTYKKHQLAEPWAKERINQLLAIPSIEVPVGDKKVTVVLNPKTYRKQQHTQAKRWQQRIEESRSAEPSTQAELTSIQQKLDGLFGTNQLIVTIEKQEGTPFGVVTLKPEEGSSTAPNQCVTELQNRFHSKPGITVALGDGMITIQGASPKTVGQLLGREPTVVHRLDLQRQDNQQSIRTDVRVL